MAAKDAEIARLQEEVKRKTGAMRTTGRPGSLLTGSGSTKLESEKSPEDPTDYKTAMREKARNFTKSIEE